jgi:hypothetical protein
VAVSRVLVTSQDSVVVEVMEYRQSRAGGWEALVVTSDPVAMFWVRVSRLIAVTDT